MHDDIFRVGNGAGFSGDRVDAAVPVVDSLIERGGPSALFFEVLGERTIALAQLERRKDPEAGYEPMLKRLLSPILKKCVDNNIAILGNFGAANPPAAARKIASLAIDIGLPNLKIAVVSGDDLSDWMELSEFPVHEADVGLLSEAATCISANAYLGAAPLVEALRLGADIVVVGRTSDPALAIAPLIHHFGWDTTDWEKMAIAATAGHLLECGSQVSGGTFWNPGLKDIPDPANIGFPIAEVSGDGNLIITKADRTGGLVDLRTVKEQLLYELHDPAHYITPDVILDITSCSLEEVGKDRVRVSGIKGRPAPKEFKVTACFEGPWLGEGEVSVAGHNSLARAKATAQVLLERIKIRRLDVRSRIDLIGVSSVFDNDTGDLWRNFDGPEPQDIRVRLAVEGKSRDEVEQASREVLALLCCGAAGTAGARIRVTPRVMTKSYLVPRGRVPTKVQVSLAKDML